MPSGKSASLTMLLYQPQYSKSLHYLLFLIPYTLQITAATDVAYGGHSLCRTFSTITYDLTATFTFGPGEGCFVLQPRPMVQSDITTSSTVPSILRRCPAFAVGAPLMDNDACGEHNAGQSRSLVNTTTLMLGNISLPAMITSVSSYVPAVPAVTELNVPLLDGKAEYISTLMDGSSSTSTSTSKAEFSGPLTSSLFSFTQDADQINSSATSPATVPLSALGFTAAAISSMLTTPSTLALVPLFAEVYLAATSTEHSTAVTTIGRFITQTVQVQVVSTTSTTDLENSPSERLNPEGPISVPGVAARTNLGQLIPQRVNTTPISIATGTIAPVSNGKTLPVETDLLAIFTSVPFTGIAGLHGQPGTSPNSSVVPTPSPPITQTASLIQTTSNSVILSKITSETETIGSINTTNDLGSLQSEAAIMVEQSTKDAPLAAGDDIESAASSEAPVSFLFAPSLTDVAENPSLTEEAGEVVDTEDAPLVAGDDLGSAPLSEVPAPLPLPPVKTPVSATAVAGAVTPGQSITFTPTVCLAPLYSPSISIIIQYQTVTVAATPNSTSSATFNPDTTFHLSIVTIAPTEASSAFAAPRIKSEADDDWTRWPSASAVFVGLLVSLYGIVG